MINRTPTSQFRLYAVVSVLLLPGVMGRSVERRRQCVPPLNSLPADVYYGERVSGVRAWLWQERSGVS